MKPVHVLVLSLVPLTAAPVIKSGGVLNNASYAVNGALNRGIAQGSVFAIFGTGLGPESLVQASAFPLQTELGGTTVRVTIGGTTVNAYPLYVVSGQVGVLLTSDTPTGNGSVTVTYQGQTSAPEPITVVRRSFGVFTANQAGSGPAIVQNFNSQTDQPLNSLLNPARPGQTVTLWGTGLGAVTGELNGPAPGNLDTRMRVFVGGTQAPVRYMGRSGCCAGIDQIVFDIPAGVEGCYVPVHVVGAGMLTTPENRAIPQDHTVSNTVTMSIASSGASCTDPTGLSATELAAMQKNGSIKIGSLSFERRPSDIVEPTDDLASARFGTFDLIGSLRSRGIFGLPATGTCVQYTMPLSEIAPPDPIQPAPLDAGAQLTVNGPNGARSITRRSGGFYGAQLGTAQSPYLTAGAYKVTGNGGADVGPFEAGFRVPSPLTWTNRDPAALARTFSPTMTWSGADGNFVIGAIFGRNDLTGFYTVCTAAPETGTLTIPPYTYAGIIQHTTGVPGTLWLGSGTFSRFTAPGLDFGFVTAIVGTNGVYIQ